LALICSTGYSHRIATIPRRALFVNALQLCVVVIGGRKKCVTIPSFDTKQEEEEDEDDEKDKAKDKWGWQMRLSPLDLIP